MRIKKKLEQWENVRLEGMITKLLMILLVTANFFLVAKMNNAGKRVTIIPPVVQEGFWVEESSASKEYLLQMADFFVTYVLTATPRSIDTKIRNFERYIDPQSYGVIKNEMYAMAEKMKGNNMSQAFLPDRATIRKQDVVISGTLKRFVGTIETTSENKSYKIGFSVKNGEIYVNSFNIV